MYSHHVSNQPCRKTMTKRSGDMAERKTDTYPPLFIYAFITHIRTDGATV